MKRDMNQPINALDGKPIQADGKALTLASVAVTALLAPHEDERTVTGEEKVKRFRLADRIYGAKEPLELTVEEAALVKAMIAKAYTPLVVGRAWALLEAEPENA